MSLLQNDGLQQNQHLRNKVMNPRLLASVLSKRIQCYNVEVEQKSRRSLKGMLTYCLTINSELNCEFFQDVQLILAVNHNIPIVLLKPKRIYWNGNVYIAEGRDNDEETRYCCNNTDCDVAVERDNVARSIHYDPTKKHLHIPNAEYKYNLINELLKQELIYTVASDNSVVSNVLSDHYHKLVRKYRYQFPCMTMHDFPPFDYLQSTLSKHKTNKLCLTSHDVSEFIKNKLPQILTMHCPSATIGNFLKNDLVVEGEEDALFMTRYSLLNILLSADALGGDGTWNIRPQFLMRGPKGCRQSKVKHRQVFKLYALKSYRTKQKIATGGTDRYITKTQSYLIAVCLLMKKKKKDYKWVFSRLKAALHVCNPNAKTLHKMESYICDFESAQRRAWESECGDDLRISLQGEEFHYKQALLTNARSNKLGIYITSRRKDNGVYNKGVRQHLEMMYNLMHVSCSNIRDFAWIIIKSLWKYVLSCYRKKKVRKRFLKFLLYYSYGWCEINKEDFITKLKLKTRYKKLVDESRNVRIEQIDNWCSFQSSIRSNNAVEVSNKHDKTKLGFHPTIDKFTLTYLELFANSIQNYEYHQQHGLSYQQVSRHLLSKNVILDNMDEEMSFNTFKNISAKLTSLKFKQDYNKLSKRFLYQQSENKEINYNQLVSCVQP